MNKLILDKITKIIELFLDKENNYKNQAKTWEVGTNFYQSLNITLTNINSKLNKNKYNYIEIKSEYDLKITKNERKYKLLLNGEHNITPTTRKNKIAAESTIRQYLQIWFALEIIEENKFRFNKDSYVIKLTNKIFDFIKYYENELIFKFLKLIPYSYYSNIDFVKNLGFSLFISLIDEYNNQNKINYFDYIDSQFKPKSQSKKYKNYTPFNFKNNISQEYIRHVKGDDTNIFGNGKKTYTQLSKEILKKYEFEDIIDSIYNTLFESYDENKNLFLTFNISSFKEKENKEMYYKLNNYIEIIKRERFKLRQNIINERIYGYGLSTKDYSDILNSLNNRRQVENMQACHIYEVEYIIKDFKLFASRNIKKIEDFENEQFKKEIDKFINDASNYNNGIFMNSDSHKIFDKHYVWFDTNGKFHYLESQKDEVIKSFGEQYRNIQINSKVLA
ncbi:MAG: HNH endonuclease, partial [Ureaplasma sp.]|nr:HNH endonuclease [Ureaplasma sp.]